MSETPPVGRPDADVDTPPRGELLEVGGPAPAARSGRGRGHGAQGDRRDRSGRPSPRAVARRVEDSRWLVPATVALVGALAGAGALGVAVNGADAGRDDPSRGVSGDAVVCAGFARVESRSAAILAADVVDRRALADVALRSQRRGLAELRAAASSATPDLAAAVAALATAVDAQLAGRGPSASAPPSSRAAAAARVRASCRDVTAPGG